MPEINALIGAKSYTLACEAGQEDRLQQAADRLHGYAKTIQAQFQTLPEDRLILMAALMMANDMIDLQVEEIPEPDTEDLELMMLNLLKTATLRLKDIQGKINRPSR